MTLNKDWAIDLNGVSYIYPDGTAVLHDISWRVDTGQRVAVLGPNGAGKTTLALHLNRLLSPTQGTVRIMGEELTDDRSQLATARRRVGLVFQDPDDQLFMPTVYQDVAFGPRNFGFPSDTIDRIVTEALQAVDMADYRDTFPGHLSFGQKRRVAIAGVLASQPDIIVLDEPTSNLDPVARRELIELLCDLPYTLVLITHDLPAAWQVCERSVIIDDGQIVADDQTSRLLQNQELLQNHRLELPFGFILTPENK